jgi:hypothetical protein
VSSLEEVCSPAEVLDPVGSGENFECFLEPGDRSVAIGTHLDRRSRLELDEVDSAADVGEIVAAASGHTADDLGPVAARIE